MRIALIILGLLVLCFDILFFCLAVAFGYICVDRRTYVNEINVHELSIGDTLVSVIEEMQSEPDKIVQNDSIYYLEKTHKDITTFIYYAPPGRSSDIYIYFRSDTVWHIWYEL